MISNCSKKGPVEIEENCCNQLFKVKLLLYGWILLKKHGFIEVLRRTKLDLNFSCTYPERTKLNVRMYINFADYCLDESTMRILSVKRQALTFDACQNMRIPIHILLYVLV